MKKVFFYSIFFLSFFKFSKSQETDLYNLSLAELMNTEVTSASKFNESINETPATILIITNEDIQNRGYISLNELISDLPGFDVAAPYSDFTQIQYARGNRTGSFNERTLFMVNGIEHNILYCQAMNIAEDFPISAIERVEILYGPASAVHGANAFSGIINVITKSASEENHDNVYLNSGFGSNNTYFTDMTYLGKQGDIDVSLSFRKYKSNRFDISEKPGYFADSQNDISKWTSNTVPVGNGSIIGNSALWGPYAEAFPEYRNLANDHGLLTKVKYKSLEVGFNNLVTIHGLGSQYPYDKAMPATHWKFIRNNGYFKMSKDMNPKLHISTLVNFNFDGSSPESLFGEGWNDTDNWNSMRNATLKTWKYQSSKTYVFEDFVYNPIENLTINGGMKYAYGTYQKSYENQSSHQFYFSPNTDFEELIDTINGEPVTIMDSLSSLNLYPSISQRGVLPGNSFHDNEYGGFLQFKLSLLNNKLFIVTGARYDDNDLYGSAFNPRIGASYNLKSPLSIKGNFGTAFQAPAPRNMYGSWGGLNVNENLKPEEILSREIGAIYTIENFSIELSAFHNIVKNSILQGKNMPEKVMHGIELKINAMHDSLGVIINKIKTHANFTFIDAKHRSTLVNIDSTRNSDLIGDIAPFKANLILGVDLLNRLHWNTRVNYVSEKQTIISNPIEKVDGFILLNTSLQWKNIFNSSFTFYTNINNVLNIEYYHSGWDSANAGEDISKPSGGWYSSRLPQPKRSFIFGIRTVF